MQEEALLALGALADKVEGKRKTGELKKATQEIEREVATQLSILARCFELQDDFRIVELDHVLATAPSRLDGHRRGVAEARNNRRATVLQQTERLMAQMDAAGGIANENVILHARAARSVIDSLNSTAALVDEFHTTLGIDSSRHELTRVPWREAVRDRDQLKTAGQEAARGAAVGVGAAAGAVVMGAKLVGKGGSKG